MLVEDFERAGIPPFDQGRDWTTYVSMWRSQFTSAFRDSILAQFPDTLYSEYGVSGDWPFGKLLWKQMRQIFTPMSKERHGQRYSTPSIYPGASGPAGWDTSSDGGLDQLDVLRPSELATSDLNFAPFVAAGWQNAEERSMRPGAWLGFLKSLATMGAEYYTVGYFNGRANGKVYGSNCTSHGTPPPFTELCPFQLAENYVWQTVIPAYAQAVTSLWRPVLFDGQLLEGDMPQERTTWGCGHSVCDYSGKFPQQNDGRPGTGAWKLNKTHNPEPVNWRFWAGSVGGSGQDKVVYVRKHTTTNDYVISGAIQPQSNLQGNVPEACNVSIRLNGAVHHFEIRTQGSVFAMSTDKSGTPSTFVQLDGWHESTHPSHWSTDFHLQAELHDDALFGPHQDARIATESVRSFTEGGGERHHDFRDSASYVQLRQEESLSFSVEPRATHPLSGVKSESIGFSIVLRLRSGESMRRTCVRLAATDNKLGQVCTRSAAWHECVAADFRAPTDVRSTLQLGATDGTAEIDWLKLVQDRGRVRTLPPCDEGPRSSKTDDIWFAHLSYTNPMVELLPNSSFATLSLSGNHTLLAQSFARDKLPGMINLEKSIWGPQLYSATPAGWRLGASWQNVATQVVDTLTPLSSYHGGPITHVMLGDELVMGGLPLAQLDALAGALHAGLSKINVKLYTNDAFATGLPCTTNATCSAWSLGSSGAGNATCQRGYCYAAAWPFIPASLDYISLDACKTTILSRFVALLTPLTWNASPLQIPRARARWRWCESCTSGTLSACCSRTKSWCLSLACTARLLRGATPAPWLRPTRPTWTSSRRTGSMRKTLALAALQLGTGTTSRQLSSHRA